MQLASKLRDLVQKKEENGQLQREQRTAWWQSDKGGTSPEGAI